MKILRCFVENFGVISKESFDFDGKLSCIYKEKIFQGKNYQLLTCEFTQNELNYISNSMQRFNDTFRVQIAKNRIFEAKLTTNGEVFQKYLANPSYCKITHSKK